MFKPISGIDQVVTFELLLGEGAFGTVHKGTLKMKVGDADVGTVVAVKTHRNPYTDLDKKISNALRIVEETRALEAAGSCGTVNKLFDAFVDTENDTWYFILEYINGVTLTELIMNSPVFEEIHITTGTFQTANNLMSEKELFESLILPLASGLSCLHEQKIAHRDIKTDNVMVTKEGPVWVDLGLSCLRACVPNNTVGNISTIAPEVMTKRLKDGGENAEEWMKTDLWSFGCVIYLMMYGEMYSVQERLISTKWKNKSENEGRPVVFLPQYPEVQQLLTICLQFDPNTRWNQWVSFNSPANKGALMKRLNKEQEKKLELSCSGDYDDPRACPRPIRYSSSDDSEIYSSREDSYSREESDYSSEE